MTKGSRLQREEEIAVSVCSTASTERAHPVDYVRIDRPLGLGNGAHLVATKR